MGLQCGLVGLPNVGKSTLFNCLTGGQAAAANYPFCTIDPNVGIATVPDGRLHELAVEYKPERILPAYMEFVDIAGLVKGASTGQGLGNQFLGHIRDVDIVMEVVRCFDHADVIHVDGSVDPVRDVEVIRAELALKDLDTLEKRMGKDQKIAQSGDKEAKARMPVFEKLRKVLDQGKPARHAGLSDDEKKLVADLHLLTAKPSFFCANVDEGSLATGNRYTEKLEVLAKAEGTRVVRICAKIEEEISRLPPEERAEFLAAMGMDQAGLDKVVRLAFDTLGLHTYFTAGPKEVRAWTIKKGWKAPQAAGVIHSDFEKGFIRAETLAFADWKKHGTWNAAKAAGALRTEGKDYVVQDGDVMHFLFSN